MASFSNLSRLGGGESSNVASYKLEGAAPHAVVLHLPGNVFNTESGSVDEPCKKKRTSNIPDWIAY